MDLIGQLYELTPKDLYGRPVAGRYFSSNSKSQAAASVAVELLGSTAIPLDQIFLPERLGIGITPGAAQNLISWTLTLEDVSGTVFSLIAGGAVREAYPAATAFYTSEALHGIGVFAAEVIKLTVVCDAGVAANLIQGWLTGWVIPRGTLQR